MGHPGKVPRDHCPSGLVLCERSEFLFPKTDQTSMVTVKVGVGFGEEVGRTWGLFRWGS